DISARAVAEAIGTPAYPLQRINVASTASGTLELQWKGTLRNAEAGFALAFTPPKNLSAGQLPTTAQARGTYRPAADELELAQLDVATRFTELRASGKMAESSLLKFSASATDLAEWQPVFAAFRGPQRLPLTIHGSASFTGIASGRLSSPSVTGHVDV